MRRDVQNLSAAIGERYSRVLEAIATAAHRVGRSPESVRLVVVTKSQPLEVVEAAIEAGAGILGENYPEEAVEKIEALKERAAGRQSIAVEWHMIGHVQSRKSKLAAQHFALVHSLDSVKLAQRLDGAAGELQRELPVLLEFNVGGEPGKQGWLASDEQEWSRLLPEVEAVAGLTRLKIRGLMTMPPLTTDPESARIYFRRLRRLQEFLRRRMPQNEWRELSMGTSADYVVAVEEGATLVRVGQAILGPRPAVEAP